MSNKIVLYWFLLVIIINSIVYTSQQASAQNSSNTTQPNGGNETQPNNTNNQPNNTNTQPNNTNTQPNNTNTQPNNTNNQPNSTNNQPNQSDDSVLQCGNYSCPSASGRCIGLQSETCICLDTYATYPKDSYVMCTYQRKFQLYTFLLELFITFGVGHFYAENYSIGVIKAIFWIICYFLFFFLRYINKKKEENSAITLFIALLGCIFCCGMIIWQIVDIIFIAVNRYEDGNGIGLYPMV